MSTAATANSSSNALNSAASTPGRQPKMSTTAKVLDRLHEKGLVRRTRVGPFRVEDAATRTLVAFAKHPTYGARELRGVPADATAVTARERPRWRLW